jgi:hypothetical protein
MAKRRVWRETGDDAGRVAPLAEIETLLKRESLDVVLPTATAPAGVLSGSRTIAEAARSLR